MTRRWPTCRKLDSQEGQSDFGLYVGGYALQTARLNLEQCNLYAPFAGARGRHGLQTLPTAEGEVLHVDRRHLVRRGVQHLRGRIAVGEHRAEGRRVSFRGRNEEFTGKVTEVNPSIDEKGQVKIRARIRNRGNVLMEG